ncbi:cytoskeleton-associated protein 2-like [Bufo gargarizans]|uniref:cytoskeleton-associated protein 2-like n=1 Tax=Bufo gargarizans TaxID=30331 RepID=UPI001CF18676|nr:cytoskeleton-associated protein 2-like [Bufo gargarizans]
MDIMEGKRSLTAQEERRLKLLEYLEAKGKLKPQDNCKPYLKDCTNLQNKRPQASSKQICETKKYASNKASHFAFESKKSKTSNAGPLLHKSSSGKIPAQQTVPSNKPGDKMSSRNPLPPKRARPEQSGGRTLQASLVPKSNARKQGRSEESDVTLTVILTKKQPRDKPEICVMGKTSTMRGQPGPQPKKREQSLSQSKQMPATKATTQATKAKILHESQPPSVAGSGHIRIVSRLSLPGAKSKSASERSFLIKSSRNDGVRQPLNVPKDRLEGNSKKQTCSTKHLTAAQVTSSTTTVHRKISTKPVSAPKIGPHRLDCSSKTVSNRQSTHLLNKQVAPRKTAGPTGCKKAVDGSKHEYNRKTVQQRATKEATTKPSLLTTTDSTIRPQTPRMTADDRKKKLEEWLSSKRKTYKRPPMILPPKRPPTAKKQNPCNRSLWEGIEDEEELLSLSNKIRQTLSECLQLIEKGISGEDIHATLDNIPEAKKFAKYWVCKARLLERDGVCDVIDMYKQGVQFGATPIDELREVVFDIMKSKSKKTKVVTFGPLLAEEVMENENHRDIPLTPFTNRTEEVKTPCTGASIYDHGSAVKLQITSFSSKKKNPGSGQEWKRLTPVRRSVRIHHSASQYPEVVQEQDTVVSSLEELLDKADTDAYLYMKNEALPEEAEHKVIGLMKAEDQQDPTEDQQEGPV